MDDPLEAALPASLPYLFTALKFSATASVVGAIIGELPSSIQDGLGGAILNFNQYYSLDPRASGRRTSSPPALGIVFFLLVVARGEADRAPGAGERGLSTAPASVSVRERHEDVRAGRRDGPPAVDLDVQPGEFVSLIGPSGCGKSTLLRVIADLVEPTRGRGVVNGKTAQQARLDRDYGIVFQDAVLYDWRTVGKNIALPLEMHRLGPAAPGRAGRGDAPARRAEGFGGHHPWQLSGGMQQRVSIARALRSRRRCS